MSNGNGNGVPFKHKAGVAVVYPTGPVAAPVLTGAPALLWSWDPADNSKITQSGGFVDALAGSDGTALTIGNTLTNRPSLSLDSNGRQCLNLNGALTQYLFANGLSLAGGHSFVVIYENNNAAGNSQLAELCQSAAGPTTQRESLILLAATGTLARKVGSGGMSNAIIGNVASGLHIAIARSDSGTNASLGSLDGATAVLGTSVSSPVTMDTFMLGARISTSVVDIPFTGLIKRAFVYSGVLSNPANLEELAVYSQINFGTQNLP